MKKKKPTRRQIASAISRLETRNDHIENLMIRLKEIEWAGSAWFRSVCPACRSSKPKHEALCWLGATIRIYERKI